MSLLKVRILGTAGSGKRSLRKVICKSFPGVISTFTYLRPNELLVIECFAFQHKGWTGFLPKTHSCPLRRAHFRVLRITTFWLTIYRPTFCSLFIADLLLLHLRSINILLTCSTCLSIHGSFGNICAPTSLPKGCGNYHLILSCFSTQCRRMGRRRRWRSWTSPGARGYNSISPLLSLWWGRDSLLTQRHTHNVHQVEMVSILTQMRKVCIC